MPEIPAERRKRRTAMPEKIVSANYRNRKSEFKWLVRDSNEHPDDAKEFKSVQATGVRFCRSSHRELGFGCTVVAMSDTAVDQSLDTKNMTRLCFGLDTFVDPNGNEVQTCKMLVLAADGAVYAIV